MSRHSKLLNIAVGTGLSLGLSLSLLAAPSGATAAHAALAVPVALAVPTTLTAPAVAQAASISATTLRIASFNIRCHCTELNPANVWDSGERRVRTATQIRATGAQIIGLQETYTDQVNDLFGSNGRVGLLGSNWSSWTSTAPEALNAIGWDNTAFTPLASGARYLTTGPSAMDGSSRAYERTVTWVKLRSRATGQTLIVFNTHLEHRGINTLSVTGQTYGQIRAIQAREVLDTIRSVNGQNVPVVLTGDFNANQNSEPFKIVAQSGLVADTRSVARTQTMGEVATFNNWRLPAPGNRIDFAFTSPSITVNNYGVHASLVNGLFASDHFPITADLSIPVSANDSQGGALTSPDTRVYSVPTSDMLYGVTGYGAATRAVPLTFDQWRALGFRAPQPAPAAFVKYTWSDDLFMVNFWHTDPSTWTWTRLNFAQWQRAKFPTPNIAGWITGTELMKYGSSDQIFATINGRTKALTFAEWQAMGFRAYTNRSTAGFVKTPNSDAIYEVANLAKPQGSALSFARWVSLGFPTPMMVARVN